MSIRLTSAVWDSGAYSGTTLIIALALADHGKDDGTCIWPSVAHLAAKARVNERTVQRTLRQLEVDGVLVCVGRDGGGRGRARQYRMDVAKLHTLVPGNGDTDVTLSGAAESDEKGDSRVTLSPAERVTPPAERVTPGAQRVTELCHPNLQEPSLPPLIPPVGAETSDPAPERGELDDEQRWSAIKAALSKTRGAGWVASWLGKLVLNRACPEYVALVAPTRLVADTVNQSVIGEIRRLWGRPVDVYWTGSTSARALRLPVSPPTAVSRGVYVDA